MSYPALKKQPSAVASSIGRVKTLHLLLAIEHLQADRQRLPGRHRNLMRGLDYIELHAVVHRVRVRLSQANHPLVEAHSRVVHDQPDGVCGKVAHLPGVEDPFVHHVVPGTGWWREPACFS